MGLSRWSTIAGYALFLSRALHAQDTCGGPDALLAVLDRPTVGDSSCVVPQGKIVLEAGINAGSVAGGGRMRTGPNAELRFGWRRDTELVYLPPNETRQTVEGLSTSGTASSVVGLKHVLGHEGNWQWTGETLVTTASGNAMFGSAHPGIAVNGIVSDGIGSVGVSFMLGASTETLSRAAGGARYSSVNPDLVITWAPGRRIQWYGEVYGATHTSYGAGSGVNADGGLQVLVTRDLELDVERGVQWHGTLGGFGQYTGVGLGLLF